MALVLFFLMPLLVWGAIGDSPPSKLYLTFEKGIAAYQAERKAMSEADVQDMLERGKALLQGTQLVDSLAEGGSALFPHASILKCGDQIAAVVQAALLAAKQSGKSKILAIGVLHSLSEEIQLGRGKEIAGENVLDYPCRGIFGPGLPHEPLLKWEFSLDNFLFLLDHALKANPADHIEVTARFVNQVYGQPENLNGIEALRQLAKESIVVATTDLRHYGINYGIPPHVALPIGQEAYAMAQREIQENLRFLKTEDLLGFRNHCLRIINDGFDVGQTLRTLLGPLEGTLHHLRLVDVSDLFAGYPSPNWVATGVVELKRM